ncbi:cocaine- and amphetamine-regulated transcript protein [Stegostoma tigrinum]|uniref:cocaine- and amphetamine-regulated transcript protein n=1 Tax=Rhincodon typus TaxID=259920 RepID=UPI0009A3B263|nr:cocaine- and amphetamine-regulated transcript protein [Rhincodon typus]XP_048383848.1 cocaine- and amphetamine-regulated transcript protein [Stegostoma tigrinum]
MESTRLCLLTLLSAALLVNSNCQDSELQARSIDRYSVKEDSSQEKELIEALQEVLEKLKSKRMPTYEKKFGMVPMCDAGEQCAVRKGARIGRLCDCPRGTFCNSFLLKCL